MPGLFDNVVPVDRTQLRDRIASLQPVNRQVIDPIEQQRLQAEAFQQMLDRLRQQYQAGGGGFVPQIPGLPGSIPGVPATALPPEAGGFNPADLITKNPVGGYALAKAALKNPVSGVSLAKKAVKLAAKNPVSGIGLIAHFLKKKKKKAAAS